MQICFLLLTEILLFLPKRICAKNEKQLYKDKMRNYSILSRPVFSDKRAVEVKLGIDVQQIVDIEWLDPYLAWEPSHYGGVKEIRPYIHKIWKPDILLYNSANQKFDSSWPTKATVYSDGSVLWMPPAVIQSTCKIDITWFPFDDQKCPMKFGSWSYAGGHMNLTQGLIERGTYTENGEWELLGVTVVRNVQKYECCPEPYMDLTFTFSLRRRTLFFGFNVIVPCVLLSLVALLTFAVPSETNEKLQFIVTIFMSLCFFLLMLTDILPQTSEAVPLITIYFSSIMVTISISMICTVFVLNFHHRSMESHEMSDSTRDIFLNWAPWILQMKVPKYISGHSIQNHSIDETMDFVSPKCKQAKYTMKNQLISQHLYQYNDYYLATQSRPSVLPRQSSLMNGRPPVQHPVIRQSSVNNYNHNNNERTKSGKRQRQIRPEIFEVIDHVKFITNALKKSKGITHKLCKQLAKHQMTEFSMEWNPNVELSSACGCALSAQPHALDSSTFGFHSIENSVI